MFSPSPPPACARGHLLSSFVPHLSQAISFASSWLLPFCQPHALRVRNTIAQESHINTGFVTHFSPPFLCHHVVHPALKGFLCFTFWWGKGCECIRMGEHRDLVECLCPVSVGRLCSQWCMWTWERSAWEGLATAEGRGDWPHAHFSPRGYHWASLDKGDWAFQPPFPSYRAPSPPGCLATWK